VSVSAGSDDVYQIDDIRLLAGNSDSLDTVVLQLEEVANPEARNDPTVREGLPKSDRLFGPGIQNVDMALARRIRLSDSVAAQLRTDFYNAFNHPNFVAPPTMQNFADASDFGALFVARSPRIVQLGLKFLW
jgi:hypothetical protein